MILFNLVAVVLVIGSLIGIALATKKLHDSRTRILEQDERIDWLTQQREVESKMKEAALLESEKCLKEMAELKVKLATPPKLETKLVLKCSLKESTPMTIVLHESDKEGELPLELSALRSITLGPTVDGLSPEPSRTVKFTFRDNSNKVSNVRGDSLTVLAGKIFGNK